MCRNPAAVIELYPVIAVIIVVHTFAICETGFAFVKVIYCGLCGSKFTRECGLTNRSGGKVRNYQYRCVNKENIDDRRCDNDRISFITLNRLVEEALEKEFSLACQGSGGQA